MEEYLLVLSYKKDGKEKTIEIGIWAETEREAKEKKQITLKHWKEVYPEVKIKDFKKKERVFVQSLGEKIGKKLKELD